MWTSKYRPSSLSDIQGNDKSIRELKEWADNWENEDDKAVILYGPPGVGKTSAAHALSSDNNWEIMEMNASDKRTGDIIERIAGESSKTASLTGSKRKLIVIDEADNLHGNKDRGGKRAITKTIKETNQPIILIANDFYDLSRTLRNNTKNIEFSYIDDTEIAKALRDICKSESIDYDVDALKSIANNSSGDLRAAINDLFQSAAGRNKVSTSDVETIERDQEEKIFQFLDKLFKKSEPFEAREISRNLDMTPNELFRWISDNIDKVYSDDEYAHGIAELAKSDVWLHRTTETQEYRYWRYASDRMTAGIAQARKEEKGGWTRWQPPQYRTNKGPSNELLAKIGDDLGYSTNTVRTEVIPLLSVLIEYCKPEELTVEIASKYNMSKSEISEITGSGKNTNKVERVYEKSQNLQDDISQSNNDKASNNENRVIDELTNVSGIGESLAKRVSDDFDSLIDIYKADASDIIEIKGISKSKCDDIKSYISEVIDTNTEDKETDEAEGQKDNNQNNDKSTSIEDENNEEDSVETEKDEDDNNQVGLNDFL